MGATTGTILISFHRVTAFKRKKKMTADKSKAYFRADTRVRKNRIFGNECP